MAHIYVCQSCLNNGVIDHCVPKGNDGKKVIITKTGKIIELKDEQNNNGYAYSINNGFIVFGDNTNSTNDKCPKCNGFVSEMALTVEEWDVLKQVSTDAGFIVSMNQLKKNDVIDFNLKLSQFRANISMTNQPVHEQVSSSAQPSMNMPTCPTCGSANVKKISSTKRWLSTGAVGIASSDMGKTMQCVACGYKW